MKVLELQSCWLDGRMVTSTTGGQPCCRYKEDMEKRKEEMNLPCTELMKRLLLKREKKDGGKSEQIEEKFEE